eukprot:m.789444 g.789444  ORF g.789444 m.789444 type:complete len:500 (+) comp23323_c0_seq17:302-1801(+)
MSSWKPDSLLPGEVVHESVGLVTAPTESGGRSLVARSDISAGTTILCTFGVAVPQGALAGETVDIVTHAWQHSKIVSDVDGSPRDIGHVIRQRCCDLYPRSIEEATPRLREQFSSRIPRFNESDKLPWVPTREELILLLLRINCNTFDMGLFPLASFFNHSCLPTCQGFRVQDAASGTMMEVRTLCDIAAGEALTISYLGDMDLCLPSDQRNEKLFNMHDFRCGCTRCLHLDDTLECALCPTCKGAICKYYVTGLAGIAGNDMEEVRLKIQSDDFYKCEIPYRNSKPCHALLGSNVVDTVIETAFRIVSQLPSEMSSGSSELCEGPNATSQPSVPLCTASTVNTVRAALCDVAHLLPVQHWIMNIAALRLSHMFDADVEERDPQQQAASQAVRLKYPFERIAAAYVRLQGALHCMRASDYAVSNSYERLGEAWQSVATMLRDTPDLVEQTAREPALVELWSLVMPMPIPASTCLERSRPALIMISVLFLQHVLLPEIPT